MTYNVFGGTLNLAQLNSTQAERRPWLISSRCIWALSFLLCFETVVWVTKGIPTVKSLIFFLRGSLSQQQMVQEYQGEPAKLEPANPVYPRKWMLR